MEQGVFPKSPGVEVSILGLGAMRLPTLRDDPSRIDEDAATWLVQGLAQADDHLTAP